MKRRKALKRVSLMLGASFTLPASMQLFSGCQADQSNTWKAVFFNDEQLSFVAELADIIIPRTETPGAKDVLAHRYIDLVLANCYGNKIQSSVILFIDEKINYCTTKFNKELSSCTLDEKHEMMKEIEELNGNTAYSTLKGLTLLAYFTSEEGMNQSLNYHAIPQRYDGCIAIDENARIYADNNVYK